MGKKRDQREKERERLATRAKENIFFLSICLSVRLRRRQLLRELNLTELVCDAQRERGKSRRSSRRKKLDIKSAHRLYDKFVNNNKFPRNN